MSMHPAITVAVANQHHRDLITQADAYRLARTARQGRPRSQVSPFLTTKRVITTAAAACRRVGTGAVPLIAARFQSPPVKPCTRFSRTRLTDVLHRRCSAFPRQSRKGLGAMTVRWRLARPRWSGDSSTWVTPHRQPRRRLPLLDNQSPSRQRA
jgi:hypothetical protein